MHLYVTTIVCGVGSASLCNNNSMYIKMHYLLHILLLLHKDALPTPHTIVVT